MRKEYLFNLIVGILMFVSLFLVGSWGIHIAWLYFLGVFLFFKERKVNQGWGSKNNIDEREVQLINIGSKYSFIVSIFLLAILWEFRNIEIMNVLQFEKQIHTINDGWFYFTMSVLIISNSIGGLWAVREEE